MDSRNHVEIKEELKKAAALASVKYIRDGMTLGLGTGSTAYYLIQEGWRYGPRRKGTLQAARNLEATEKLAVSLGFPLSVRKPGLKWIWRWAAWMKSMTALCGKREGRRFSGEKVVSLQERIR